MWLKERAAWKCAAERAEFEVESAAERARFETRKQP
jgi:hypothetical protein